MTDADIKALSRLLVALGEVVYALEVPYPEPDGYERIQVVVPFTLAEARACYPALHRALLGRSPPTDAELSIRPPD